MNPPKEAVSNLVMSRITSKLDYGNWTAREKVALSCNILALEGHSETLAGQITLREADGTFLTSPLAYGFDEIEASSIIRINDRMEVLEGSGAPNPAIRFHMWIYRQRPEVNSIIHTHPPYVSALSMTGHPLAVAHMDATPFHDDCAFLSEWPGLPIADYEGEVISAALGIKRSILLVNHGFLAATTSIEESLYLSVLIERAARNQLQAMSSYGALQPIDPELAKESHDFLLQPSIVRASFAMFARRALRSRR
ncbi:aldolase [Pseudomonas sp.]|jgi:L-fuculose-phosphate aldolase|uniref:aldolase n=1 Tax=Pseudomonas sp. TaxID=306 RepID=UPI00326628DF